MLTELLDQMRICELLKDYPVSGNQLMMAARTEISTDNTEVSLVLPRFLKAV
jgi:hypothetical protein